MSDLLDGPGEAGCFLGLGTNLLQREQPRICIVPVPFEASTSYGHGTAGGPEAIIEASRNMEVYDVETDCELYQLGIQTDPAIDDSDPLMMLRKLESRVGALLEQGVFPVVLGGEHTVSAAPIRAAASVFPGLSVLQFDAHTDLRDTYEGNPLSHASVMARVRECPNVHNIVACGIRAMDKSELVAIPREDLFFDHQLRNTTEWLDAILDRLEPYVYISFDIDVFDSSIMPGTGTPEPGGMHWFQALSLLKKVCEERTVVGFDLVELMPLEGFQAPNFLCAKLVYKFLNYRFAAEYQQLGKGGMYHANERVC